jgi:hypothetical protein
LPYGTPTESNFKTKRIENFIIFLSTFKQNHNVLADFIQTSKYEILTKPVLWGAAVF